VDTAETRLRALKEELCDRLVRLDRHVRRSTEPLSADFVEQAVQRQNDVIVDGLWHATVQELRDVNAALERLGRKAYGACEHCGKPIAARRLEVLPYTTRCSVCALIEDATLEGAAK
jgi:RNA polymerase-binding transcription factor DksA